MVLDRAIQLTRPLLPIQRLENIWFKVFRTLWA